MLGVDLCKTENLGVGQLPAVFLFYLVQVGDFLWREGESFLLVVSLNVFHKLDRLWLAVHVEDVLVQSLIHALQHRIVLGIFRFHGEIFLDTRNAFQTHVLRDFHSIGTPRSYHFASWTHIKTVYRVCLQTGSVAVKPTKFVDFFLIGLMINLSCNNALC